LPEINGECFLILIRYPDLKFTWESSMIIASKQILFLTVFFLCAFSMESSAQISKPCFTDVTAQSGIDFRYTFGDYSYNNILESSGSGITIFDYNNDGFMDLFMLNGTWIEGISYPDGKIFRNATNKLYRNNRDGTFTDVTK